MFLYTKRINSTEELVSGLVNLSRIYLDIKFNSWEYWIKSVRIGASECVSKFSSLSKEKEI